MSIVRPSLEYGTACCDLYREGQISALDRVQKKAAKSAHHTNIQHWNQLPAEVLGNLPCKTITFKKRVRKVIIELN